MSDLIIKKNGTDYKLPMLAEHYPADRVYIKGDINKDLESIIQTGTAVFNLNAGQMLNVDVTFNKAYQVAPKVFTQVRGSFVPHDEVSFPVVVSVSTTGCILRLKNNYSTSLSISVDWLAMGF